VRDEESAEREEMVVLGVVEEEEEKMLGVVEE
jgi:hypothetical protein